MSPAWQVAINVISTVLATFMIGVSSYLLKSVLDYRKQLVNLQQDFLKFQVETKMKIEHINLTCADRLVWIRRLDTSLSKLNVNIVKIGVRLQMAEQEFEDINNNGTE
jgi:hypothetical protein